MPDHDYAPDREPGQDDHVHPEWRERMIGHILTERGDELVIDHLFLPGDQKCPHCGDEFLDPGAVGLIARREVDLAHRDGDAPGMGCGLVLSVPETLELIERLQRTVGIVQEAGEDPPDLSREMARLRVEAGGPDPTP